MCIYFLKNMDTNGIRRLSGTINTRKSSHGDVPILMGNYQSAQ